MVMRSFPGDLTPEDHVTDARWVRCLVVTSGCAVLLLLGLLLALGIPGDEASGSGAAAGRNRPAASVGKPGIR
jgi:hypothetical protein